MTTGKEDLLQALAEAYLMEKGTREFYSHASRKSAAPEVRRAFDELSRWEKEHMEFIQYLYQAIMEDRDVKGFDDFRERTDARDAEGGVSIRDLETKFQLVPITDEADAISMALELEGKAYSLYWHLSKKAADSNARVVFGSMMEQEISHIGRLKDMMTGIRES